MTIDDIIRFFSGAADGQRMTDQPMTPINQVMSATPTATTVPQAGGGRGFVNPPVVRPAAPRPAGVSVPSDDGTTPGILAQINEMQAPVAPAAPVAPVPPVAAAMAQGPSAESLAPDNRDIGGGQNFAMQGPAQPGILQRMGFQDGNQAMMALGGALMAAGSPDPAKTALGIQQQQAENAKIAEARRKANMPKVDPIAGTPFFQITYPDGRTEVSNNPALAEYYKKQSESKANAAIEKAVLEDRLARSRDQSKADIKASEDARPLLNDIQGLKSRWQEAYDIVAPVQMGQDNKPLLDASGKPLRGSQGTMAQIQGIPGISAVAGFFGGNEVAKNKFLEGLTVDETLLNTARTKGAISNQEMNLFKSPIPSLTDDREKVWKPWIEKRLEVLDKIEKFQAAEVARTGAGAASIGAPVTPGGLARPANKADFDALPKGARFIAPDGKEYIK